MACTTAIPDNFSHHTVDLTNKHILITGATSEVGAAISKSIAHAGANVILLDRKERDLIPVYDEVATEKCEPLMVAFDLLKASDEDFEMLATTLKENFSEIHGLVHCAMWGAPLTPLEHCDSQTWQTIAEQNLIRPMTLTRHLYPLLNHTNPASIIFSVLGSGRRGQAYWGPIGSAFAGVENLIQTISIEWSNRLIRANSIDCGKIKTALRKQFYPGENITGLRNPDDLEIIRHYLYLLSNESIAVTGAQFSVPSLTTQ